MMTSEAYRFRDREILEQYLSFAKMENIEETHGIKRDRIYEILRSQGISGKYRKEQRNQEIIFAFQLGIDIQALHEKYNLSLRSIREVLRAAGTPSIKEAAKIRRDKVYRLLNVGVTSGEIVKRLSVSKRIVNDDISFLRHKGHLLMHTRNKKCQICNSEFQKTNNAQKYCPACAKKLRGVDHNNKIVWSNSPCEFCGKPYRVRRSNKSRNRFCSLSCSQKVVRSSDPIRNDEIEWLCNVQDLTSKRIGEIFDLTASAVRRIIKKVERKRIYAKAMRGN